MSTKKDDNFPVGIVECSAEQITKEQRFTQQLEKLHRSLLKLVSDYYSDLPLILRSLLETEINELFVKLDKPSKGLKIEINPGKSHEANPKISTLNEQKQKISEGLIVILKEHDDDDKPIKEEDLLW